MTFVDKTEELENATPSAATTSGSPGPARPGFVPRSGSGPVRASEMLLVEPEDQDLTAGQPDVDPMQELLDLDTERVIQTEVDMSPDLKGAWIVQAMSNELNQELLEKATYYKENPRTHEQVRDLDNTEFTRLVVAHNVVQPNLLDERLYRKHKVSVKRPDLLVSKILLPGQIDRLAGTIMRLSGFRDDLIKVAKNSSKRED